MDKNKQFIAGLTQAWRDEMRSAKNYHALAGKETNDEKRSILIRMAEAEERHAERWAERLRQLGADPGLYRESLVDRIRRWMLLKSDAVVAAKMLEAGESQADKLYDVLLANAETERDRASLTEAQRDERSHTRMLEEFEGRPAQPQRQLDTILGRETWHVRAGGWIGQAIYGVNDGLGAAFGVVSGVAGATSANGEFALTDARVKRPTLERDEVANSIVVGVGGTAVAATLDLQSIWMDGTASQPVDIEGNQLNRLAGSKAMVVALVHGYVGTPPGPDRGRV